MNIQINDNGKRYNIEDLNNNRLDAHDHITLIDDTGERDVNLDTLQADWHNQYGISKIKGLRLAPLKEYIETMASWHKQIDDGSRNKIEQADFTQLIVAGEKAGLSDVEISNGLAVTHGELFELTIENLTDRIKAGETIDNLDDSLQTLDDASNFYLDNISAKRASTIQVVQDLPHDKEALNAIVRSQLGQAYAENANSVLEKIKSAISDNADPAIIYEDLGNKLADSISNSINFTFSDIATDEELQARFEIAYKEYANKIASFADQIFQTKKQELEQQLANTDPATFNIDDLLNQASLTLNYYLDARNFAQDFTDESIQRFESQFYSELSNIFVQKGIESKTKLDQVGKEHPGYKKSITFRRGITDSDLEDYYSVVNSPENISYEAYLNLATDLQFQSLAVSNPNNYNQDQLSLDAFLDVVVKVPNISWREKFTLLRGWQQVAYDRNSEVDLSALKEKYEQALKYTYK